MLEVAVNPACSFRVDASWTRTINSEIKANGGSRACLCVCVCDRERESERERERARERERGRERGGERERVEEMR